MSQPFSTSNDTSNRKKNQLITGLVSFTFGRGASPVGRPVSVSALRRLMMVCYHVIQYLDKVLLNAVKVWVSRMFALLSGPIQSTRGEWYDTLLIGRRSSGWAPVICFSYFSVRKVVKTLVRCSCAHSIVLPERVHNCYLRAVWLMVVLHGTE